VPLRLTPESDGAPTLTPVVETTDDGATWVMWAEDPDDSGHSDVVVRRIDPAGVPGERRVLSTTTNQFTGSVALAPLPGGDVRVAYSTNLGETVEERRLTPSSTGDPVTVYDKTTTDDGDAIPNGILFGGTVSVASAPDGASWVTFVRLNDVQPIVSARRIASNETLSSLGGRNLQTTEFGAVADLTGRLIIAVRSGAQGRMVVIPVATDGTFGSEVEIRPVYGSSAGSATPAIGIDGAGIATVGWRLDVSATSDRYIEVRRVDTTTTPVTPLGSGATAMNDDLAQFFGQYGPLFGVDPGGGAVMAWYETDSFQDNNDALVRVLADGAFADDGVIGPRMQLDGPPPDGGSVSDVVPAGAGIVTAFFYHGSTCGAPRIDTATGDIVSNDVISATGCSFAMGPASGANGIAATWINFPDGPLMASRYVTEPPECSDGAAATLAAGETVTLPLACTGWRPQRQIVGSPARGTLGVIDDADGTVTYTAGSEGGPDLVRFRAVNGAGAGAERSIPITVTAASVSQPPPPPPDTSDRTAPAISSLSLKPNRLRLRKLRTPTLAFSLSESATVNVTVQRLVDGRRKRGRCVTKPRPRRGARCVKATTVKRLSSALPAGPAGLKIALRRPVKAGRYRVAVSATDTAGNISKAVRVSLTITRR
jgi:hypothetical protein